MALTVTQTADPGAPRVGITVDGLSATTACTVILSVSWDGGATWVPVRGGNRTGVLGAVFVPDHVPPLNVTATYRAVVTGGTTVTWTTQTLISSTTAWIQDPLAPKTAVPLYADMSSGHVLLTTRSLTGGRWGQQEDIASVVGTNVPAASLSVRQKIAGLPLSLMYEVASEGGRLQTMLMSAGQVVIRGLPADQLLDPVAHCSIGDANETRYAHGTISEWTLTARQVQPITFQIVVPWWTFDDVKVLVQSQLGPSVTFDQVKTAQPTGKTFVQWQENPGVAG